MPPGPQKLTGRQKAAILLMTLGTESSASVLKSLPEDDVMQIAAELANVRSTPTDVISGVIEEFYQLSKAHHYLTEGGLTYAKNVLMQAFGPEKAGLILDQLGMTGQLTPFQALRRVDAEQVLSIVQNEHPQTISLILAYLKSEQAAVILARLPRDLQVDVAARLATMEKTSPEVIRAVEQVIEEKFSALIMAGTGTTVGGIKTLVEAINRTDRTTEKSILDGLMAIDPELADEVKKQMFAFEDIVILDDRSVQRIMREVDSALLGKALKNMSEQVKAKVFRNMSERASQMLREDLEFMGPVLLRDVEEAQSKIVGIIRQLEEDKEIVISRGGEELVV